MGWATPYVIATIVIGVALLIAFIVWEHFAKHPLMPLQHWKNLNFALVGVTACSLECAADIRTDPVGINVGLHGFYVSSVLALILFAEGQEIIGLTSGYIFNSTGNRRACIQYHCRPHDASRAQ